VVIKLWKTNGGTCNARWNSKYDYTILVTMPEREKISGKQKLRCEDDITLDVQYDVIV
jgi:hypothetical protein